jgi:hypothetical protein
MNGGTLPKIGLNHCKDNRTDGDKNPILFTLLIFFGKPLFKVLNIMKRSQ